MRLMMTPSDARVTRAVNVRISTVRHGPIEEFSIDGGILKCRQTPVHAMSFIKEKHVALMWHPWRWQVVRIQIDGMEYDVVDFIQQTPVNGRHAISDATFGLNERISTQTESEILHLIETRPKQNHFDSSSYCLILIIIYV